MTTFLSLFIDLFVMVFNVLILTRVIGSYVLSPHNKFYEWVVSATEPVLAPVRKVLPRTPGFDIAPLATFFLLQGLQILAHGLLGI